MQATNSVMARQMRACSVFLLPLYNFEQNFKGHLQVSAMEGEWSDGSGGIRSSVTFSKTGVQF